MNLTLEKLREACRKVGKLPTLRGSPWICLGNAYRFTYKDPLTGYVEDVVFMNDEELELLQEETNG